jgi:hypothetical protein
VQTTAVRKAAGDFIRRWLLARIVCAVLVEISETSSPRALRGSSLLVALVRRQVCTTTIPEAAGPGFRLIFTSIIDAVLVEISEAFSARALRNAVSRLTSIGR